MLFDARNRRPVAVAKIPRNPQFTTGIEREYEACRDGGKNEGISQDDIYLQRDIDGPVTIDVGGIRGTHLVRPL